MIFHLILEDQFNPLALEVTIFLRKTAFSYDTVRPNEYTYGFFM